MRIAIPTANNQLCMHFGHCETFVFYDVDEKNKKIISQKAIEPPPHEPGKLPGWIKEQGGTVIIAGGMGGRARDLFSAMGIDVVVGAEGTDPQQIVMDYLNNVLKTGKNTCDH